MQNSRARHGHVGDVRRPGTTGAIAGTESAENGVFVPDRECELCAIASGSLGEEDAGCCRVLRLERTLAPQSKLSSMIAPQRATATHVQIRSCLQTQSDATFRLFCPQPGCRALLAHGFMYLPP
eukprot:350888-Chlamydomonas_euryale.AAC.10